MKYGPNYMALYMALYFKYKSSSKNSQAGAGSIGATMQAKTAVDFEAGLNMT